MKVYSTTKKIFSGIANILVSAIIFYTIFIVLFSTAPIWIVNLVMFYMNVIAILLFLSAILSTDDDKKIFRKNRLSPLWVGVIYDVAIVIMFAAAGWWYYATLGMIILFSCVELFSK